MPAAFRALRAPARSGGHRRSRAPGGTRALPFLPGARLQDHEPRPRAGRGMSVAEPADADVPVLTQVFEDLPLEAPAAPPAPATPATQLDQDALDALADQLERGLLERLGPEIDRATARALNGVRAELTVSVMQIVRESVTAAVAQALRGQKKG